MLTNSQLKKVVKTLLKSFNDEKVVLEDTTVLSDVISPSDGITQATASMNLFKGCVIWTLNKAGNKVKKFPNDWIGLTVAEFSESLVKEEA